MKGQHKDDSDVAPRGPTRRKKRGVIKDGVSFSVSKQTLVNDQNKIKVFEIHFEIISMFGEHSLINVEYHMNMQLHSPLEWT